MNRSYWCELGQLLPGEKLIHQASEVRIYDGDERTDFEVGTLQLTTHRLLWDDVEQEGHTIAFDLKLTQSTDTVAAGFMRSAKIKVYFISIPPNKPAGPSGKHDYIQLSFRKGGQEQVSDITFHYSVIKLHQFNSQLSVQLVNRLWEKIPEAVAGGLKLRKGIVGIERNMEKKQRESDYQVSVAFKDLDALIDKAKEMVNVVNKFAAKMEEKKGSITEDETAQFRSYMLSVGISNPVTRDTQVSTSKYHSELSRELADFLQLPLIESGGMMSVTDVYCMYNRARGMELVSPDDVVTACRLFATLSLPMRLRAFDSGVLVVQSLAHDEQAIIDNTAELVYQHESLTAHDLAHQIGIAIMLASERLAITEKAGRICKDDSVEGLRFYPNRFLDEQQ